MAEPTIHEICETLQSWDGSFYAVDLHKAGAFYYCVLMFVIQDEANIVAVGRGRSKASAENQCRLDYKRNKDR